MLVRQLLALIVGLLVLVGNVKEIAGHNYRKA
jgi:hypothetical protein